MKKKERKKSRKVPTNLAHNKNNHKKPEQKAENCGFHLYRGLKTSFLYSFPKTF